MGTLAEGIKEIFATAKTTGSNIMLCGNDGTPDGHMTMANLISVLGVEIPKNFGKIDSAKRDEISDISYTAYLYSRDAPFMLEGFLMTIGTDHLTNGGCIQYFTPYTGDYVVTRTYNWDSHTWTNWKKFSLDIPDFYKSYSDLSSLANALGVIQNKNIQQEKDLNNIFDIGFYLIRIDDGIYINKPIGAGNYGALVVFACGNYTLQVWIDDTIGSKMYIRGNWSGGYNNWYVWREIALTAQ